MCQLDTNYKRVRTYICMSFRYMYNHYRLENVQYEYDVTKQIYNVKSEIRGFVLARLKNINVNRFNEHYCNRTET